MLESIKYPFIVMVIKSFLKRCNFKTGQPLALHRERYTLNAYLCC